MTPEWKYPHDDDEEEDDDDDDDGDDDDEEEDEDRSCFQPIVSGAQSIYDVCMYVCM